MLIPPSYFLHKKLLPGCVNIETQLQKIRQIEEIERDAKKQEKSALRIQRYKTLAGDQNNAEAQYCHAEILLEEGNLPQALTYMKRAAGQKRNAGRVKCTHMALLQ